MTESPTVTAPIADRISGVTRIPAAAAPCIDEGQFGCFLPGPQAKGSFISQEDLTYMTKQLGTGNLAKQQVLMQQMFARYKAALRTLMSGAAFSGVTDE